jgi:hypothetical protein
MASTAWLELAMMRFFTPEWFSGDMTDTEYELTIQKYVDHLALVRKELPSRLIEFVDNTSLHDALVRRAILRDTTFQIELRAGDLQRGYSDLTLFYGGVVAVVGRPSVMDIIDDELPEIIEDEIDIVDLGVFEHRLLFASNGEIMIQFRNFDFLSFPATDREFTRETPAFVHA